jgi:very-short-patch-repair endonuclease
MRQSAPAKAIEAHLKELKIIYRVEVRYDGCKANRTLPFDFEIIVNGRVAVIEYDGEQHFQYVSKFHGQDRSNLDKQRKRDIKKTTFAYQQQFSLLRISYKEQSDITKIIDAFIAAMRSGKTVHHFSNPELYSEHIRICGGGRWCCIM